MGLQQSVSPLSPKDFPPVVEVWEASVRATHLFLREADIQFFKSLVRDALYKVMELACVRDEKSQIVGFVGVVEGKVEMLFIHPLWRGQGIGRRLLEYAVKVLGSTKVDVNEQNEQAVGFYLRMGFEVKGRSELDSLGKPFPLLHMHLRDLAQEVSSDEEAI
jgi:putative acetyltransferase